MKRIDYIFKTSLMVFLLLGSTNSVQASVEELPSSTLIKDKDGTTIETRPDGTKIITSPDGTTIQVDPNGTKFIKRPNGTSIQVNPDGSKSIKNPDGTSVEVKPGQ